MLKNLQNRHEKGCADLFNTKTRKSDETQRFISRLVAVTLLSFTILTSGWGKFAQFEVLNPKKHHYSYKEVCDSMGFRERPLTEMASGGKLDCMGDLVSIDQFCLKSYKASPSYMRGFEKNGKVICELGDRVIAKYTCDGSMTAKDFCYDSARGCKKIGKSLVRNLQIYHQSMTRDLDGKALALNCIFTVKTLLKNNFKNALIFDEKK